VDSSLYGDDTVTMDDGSQVDGEGSGGEETFQGLDEADGEGCNGPPYPNLLGR